MKWEPIETAPKAGKQVDLWVVTGHGDILDGFRVCEFHFEMGQWRRSDGDSLGYLYARDDIWPTHWMEGPEPPK